MTCRAVCLETSGKLDQYLFFLEKILPAVVLRLLISLSCYFNRNRNIALLLHTLHITPDTDKRFGEIARQASVNILIIDTIRRYWWRLIIVTIVDVVSLKNKLDSNRTTNRSSIFTIWYYYDNMARQWVSENGTHTLVNLQAAIRSSYFVLFNFASTLQMPLVRI